MADLRADRERVARLWNDSREPRVPLAVAAAFTFHHAHRIDEALLPRNEYGGALDIAAAALACLVPIYTPDHRGEPVAVRIDFARQMFSGGAAEVRCADGSIIAPLAVVRSEVLPALQRIERSGIEYVAPRPWKPGASDPAHGAARCRRSS